MLAIRRAVIEYGALPIATWLHHLADSNAIVTLLEEVKKVAVHIDNRCASSVMASVPFRCAATT